MLVPPRWPPTIPGDQELLGEVMRSGQWTDGPYTRELEERWAAQVQARQVVAFNSCTSALHAAAAAMGVRRGSKVATAGWGFAGTVTGLSHLGADIRWVDVDPLTGLADPDDVPAGMDLLLPVDMHGRPHELPRDMHGQARVLTDACQAHGALVDDGPVGRAGTHCWSFSAAKMIAAPDGGAVSTDDDDLAAELRILRDYGTAATSQAGRASREVWHALGHNWRITELSAALILNRLPLLELFVQRAADTARTLEARMMELGEELQAPPSAQPGAVPAWHKFRIGVNTGQPARDAKVAARLKLAFTSHGVPWSEWGTVLADAPAWRDETRPLLPGARRLAATTLVVGDERRPLQTWRTEETIRVCDAMAAAWQETIRDEYATA